MRRMGLSALGLLAVLAGFDWSGALIVIGRELKSANPQTRSEAVKKLADFDAVDAAPLLLPVLSDPDDGVRIEAARVLGRKHVTAAVRQVAEWIASPDKATRVAAASVLGDIGSTDATAPLVRALADSETEVRRAAVDALGEIGGRAVASPLIGRLDDEAATVRREAAEKLMDLGDRQAVIPLLERFGDANKEVRIAAIRAVGRLGDGRAVPALVRLLRDPLDDVRVAAVEALGNLRAREALGDLIPLLSRGSEDLRVKAAYALGKIGDPAAVRELVKALASETLRPPAREALQTVGEPAVEPLVACLGGGLEACDAASAVSVLRVVGDRRATAALVAELARGRVRRGAVVQALGAIGDPAALQPLLGLVDDPDPEVRRLALEAMRPILDARASDALVRLLSDKSPAVRELAAADLGTLRATAAVPRLLELAARDPLEPVAAAAVRSLGQMGDARAVEPLLGLLSGGRPRVARDAADALGRLRDPRTRPGLLTVARDPSAPARGGAVWALGSVLRGQRDDEARRLFEELARGGDVPLALAAIDALAANADAAAVPELERIARGPSRELRRAAIEALGNLPLRDAAGTDTLLVGALDADDDALRAAAAWALAKRGGSAGQAELVRVVHGKGYAGAVNAAAALAVRAPATGRALLEELAGSANPYVRANATYGLGSLPADDALLTIVGRMSRDPHKTVRATSARVLRRIGKNEAALVTLAHDVEREVRRAAADTAPASGTDWIHIYVTDDDHEPTRHALYVLARPDGLVKAGYTDLRGELGEERIPPGTADLDLVSSSDPSTSAVSSTAERAP